ncbi:MAP kinase tyrosine/serine/threonine phosphatase [Aureococcus anophagefferens]|nr:MAP kinase tyrosine/serine/threonine phosphatase [Aureococcus anophagefferens]
MANKSATAILVDAKALRRDHGDAILEAAVEVAKYFALGRGGNPPKTNEVSVAAFNTADSVNPLQARDPDQGRHVTMEQRLEKPGPNVFRLLSRPPGEWPAAGADDESGAVDGIIYAVDEIKARVAQLKYAKRVFVLTDDRFELADADGMDGAVAEFKGCLDYAIKTEGFGFHALVAARKIAAKKTSGSFDLCAPADAAVVAAEACGRLGAATRAGKMQIRLLGLAVDVKATKLVKAAATPPLKKEAAESGGDVARSTANAVAGQTDDVPDEDIVKGWMYGGEYLPTPDNASSGHGREAEDDAGEACRVLGFAAESSHDVMTSLGDALRVHAADGDARGAAFLAGLARALTSAGAVAVCRWRNTARKKEEDLRLLVPDRADPEALVAHRVPFTDDLRSVADLAPLDLAAPEFAAAARACDDDDFA